MCVSADWRCSLTSHMITGGPLNHPRNKTYNFGRTKKMSAWPLGRRRLNAGKHHKPRRTSSEIRWAAAGQPNQWEWASNRFYIEIGLIKTMLKRGNLKIDFLFPYFWTSKMGKLWILFIQWNWCESDIWRKTIPVVTLPTWGLICVWLSSFTSYFLQIRELFMESLLIFKWSLVKVETLTPLSSRDSS